MLSQTEENYLKAIFSLCQKEAQLTTTNAIAARLELKPATVTAMLIKLNEKKYINYQKYGKVKLTTSGSKQASLIVRNHRLWEVFLHEKLQFAWHEVHEVAEQLEHIRSEKLIENLDRFLGHPKFDPHGDPIPDASGKFSDERHPVTLSSLKKGNKGIMVGVKDSSDQLLKYLHSIGLVLGKLVRVNEVVEYDGSIHVLVSKTERSISGQVAKNILVTQQ